MAGLPPDVLKVGEYLKHSQGNELSHIASLLIVDDNPDIAAMWKSLEKRKPSLSNDDLWVYAFLEAAKNSHDIPSFCLLSKKDRDDLNESVKSLNSVARKLVSSELDMHLVHCRGTLFNGLYFFEDFGLKNQHQIDEAGDEKVLISRLLNALSDRLIKRLEEEPQGGKVGRNAHAIRFARALAGRFQIYYGETLLAVIATATNAMFQMEYTESDIRKLLSR